MQNHDHVLHTNEAIKGIQMVKHVWKMCAEMLWPVNLLPRDQRLKFHNMVERMCPRLDDVQALALALAEGDQLSWTKSTHFIQELESHPARKTFNRKRIISVLCDEYLSAIVIPTLQAWQEVFTWVDWNHSRSVGFVELKQGLCACNTPEVNLMRCTADINSVVCAAKERLLKDKFFRIATSLFEQSAVDRLTADPSASKLTCRQSASRHKKIWMRAMTQKSSFIDDIEDQYILLDNAISQDDVEQVEACMTSVRNRLCHHLRELRSHISWLKSPAPALYAGEWLDHDGASLTIQCTGSSICVTQNGRKYPSLGACRAHFTIQLTTWGGRSVIKTFAFVDADVLEECCAGTNAKRWHRRGAAVRSASFLPETTPLKKTRARSQSVGVLRTPRPLSNVSNFANLGGRNEVGVAASANRRRRTTSFALPPSPAVTPAREIQTSFAPPPSPMQTSFAPSPVLELELELEMELEMQLEPEPEPEPELTHQLELKFDLSHLGDLPPIHGLNAGFSPFMGSPRSTRSARPSATACRQPTTSMPAGFDRFLSAEQYESVLGSFKERVLERGCVIQLEGQAAESATEFCVVQEGSVVCTKGDLEVCSLKRGECFGEIAPFGETPCANTVAVETEQARLLCISRTEFWAAMQVKSATTDAEPEPATDADLHAEMSAKLDMLLANARDAPFGGALGGPNRVLHAAEIDAMAFEEACKDLNELAAASWRAIMVCKQLLVTRQTTSRDESSAPSWKLHALLTKVVRSFRARRIAKVVAEFGPHETIIMQVQARIRGFLERRHLRQDSAGAKEVGAAAAKRDLADIKDAELDFWDWPRVLEHCYMWHATPDSKQPSSSCFPEILLQKEVFHKKMGKFKQALQAWNELFTLMDTNSNGSVSREELQSALFAFSHMGLIAEPPKMQPLDQFCSPFLRKSPPEVDTPAARSWFCCRKNKFTAQDPTGSIKSFKPGEVLLLGEEGVPMTGCWGVDLEFQNCLSKGDATTCELPSEISFHCLVKSYTGDAIVAVTNPTDRKMVFFVAPKFAFAEQAEAHIRLQQVFDDMDPSRYLCEVDLACETNPSWFRLLIVGESTQTISDDQLGDPDWDGDRTAMQVPSFFRDRDETELAPLIGTSMVHIAVGSPASSIGSFRTPIGSPNLTPGRAMKQLASLSERRGGGSFNLTPGLPSARRHGLMHPAATPITPGQSGRKGWTRSRRLSICNPELTPRTVTPGQGRPKAHARSRRLSICEPGSPAESDGWSDDEEMDTSFSETSTQKMHVYLLKGGADASSELTEDVLVDNVWTGQFNFVDCYALGNHYDAVCCRADSCINWSAGELRNFKLFGMDQQFMAEVDANVHQKLTWVGKAIELAESHREGRCMQEEASNAGIVVHLGMEDEPSPMSRSRSRSNIRLATPRGKPIRMSSRFVLSPHSPRFSPRSPFPRVSTPSAVISPAGPLSPIKKVKPRQTRSSYQTLADKLKNDILDRKEEKQVDVAIELNKQPLGSLLWMKYKLEKKGTSISFVEPGDDKSHVRKSSGYAWKNVWECDLSPEFPLSTGLVFREDLDFLQDKSRRIQRLVRAANEALDDDYLQNKEGYDVNGDDDVLIDGAKFFLLRGDIAKRDPGLNSMFTGKQVKHASKAVQRQMRVDTDTLQSILAFFLLPPRAFCQMLGDMKRTCCAKRKHTEVDASSYNVATRSIMTYLFRTQKRSPRTRVMLSTMLLWICCLVPLVVYVTFENAKLSTQGIEIFVNTSYYLWAILCVATVIASDIRGIPGHVSFKQASLKAEIAAKPCSMTKISDGMPLTTSAMAIVQMVCRQHCGDDEDEEEEEGEEEEAGMDFSSKLLKLFWQQDAASDSLPWLQGQMQHDTQLSSMSQAQLNRMLVFEFQLKDPPRDVNDSLFNLNISVQGVQSKIDTGRPKTRAKVTVGVLAVVHGFLGLIHRTAFRQQHAFGQGLEEHASAIGTCICTTIASYIVYSILLRTGLKWWMVHLFLKQTHSAILVEEAITNHLPCYMDLRNQGNLDSWYSARQYLQEETNAECFAHKDQLPIAIAMIMCAGLSVNALTTYFAGGAAGGVDFSAAPGILISLFNLVVIGVLLLIPLMALEKINMETSVLLRKMNQVAVELGKTLEENVDERFREQQRAEASLVTKAVGRATAEAYAAAQAGATEAELRGRIADMDAVVVELKIREKLMMEQQFLLSIVQELRDTKSSKKIFGFAVDRNMLTKIFAGIGTCIYIIIKEYFAALLPGLSSAANAPNATAG